MSDMFSPVQHHTSVSTSSPPFLHPGLAHCDAVQRLRSVFPRPSLMASDAPQLPTANTPFGRMSRLAKHTPFGFLPERAHQVAMLEHSTPIKHGRFVSPHQLWNLLYILGKGTQCCIFGRGCLGSFPSLTGRLSISVSPLDSDYLFCIKWEFLLWTWLPAHERTVLHLQVKSRLGFKRFASVAELCEGLVVLIQAFFAFSKGQKT